jgi:glucose-1-phosphate adenylyltransferase
MEVNLALAKGNSNLKLDNPNWIIHTRSLDMSPVHIGENAKLKNALLSHGSHIEGNVSDSVIGLGVHIGKNSTIKNSVIFNECYIGDNTTINGCIIDRRVKIGNNCSIGVTGPNTPNKEKPDILKSGITVIERKAVIPNDVTIGKNCRVLVKSDFSKTKNIESGTSFGVE